MRRNYRPPKNGHAMFAARFYSGRLSDVGRSMIACAGGCGRQIANAQFLVNGFDGYRVYLFLLLSGTCHECPIGQLAYATRNAAAELMETGDGRCREGRFFSSCAT